MAQLTKISAGQILPGQEFWKLDNGFQVIASVKEGMCTLFVSGKGVGKRLELVSKYLVSVGVDHSLVPTIDSQAIVVSAEKKQEVLEFLERWES